MFISRVLALSLCLAAPATAQEAFSWHYDALYPIDPAQTALNLVATQEGLTADTEGARLPGGLIWARCVPGGEGGNVALRLEAFPVSALAFDEYAFQMTDGAGTVLTLQAPLANREIDQPTGGLEVFVAHDGPELAMLATAPIVTYGIVGFTDFQLPFDLSGNQEYVTRFIEDCGALNAPDPGAGDLAQSLPDVSVPFLEADLGPDLTGHVWSRFTNVVEGDPFATLVEVFYSVPETDDVVIAGRCEIGNSGPYAVMQFSADVGGLSDGDETRLQLISGAGRSAVVPGRVIGTQAEFGISGVEVALDLDDLAWLVIAGDELLSIDRAEASARYTISGNGPNTIGPFIADCDEIAQLTPDRAASPSAPIGAQAGFLSCENFGRVASRQSETAHVLNYINATSGYRLLTWIDPEGRVQDVTALNPGEAAAFTTDPEHFWMVTDGLGNCLEMIEVPTSTSDYRITVIP